MRRLCFLLAVLLLTVFCGAALADSYPPAATYEDRQWQTDMSKTDEDGLPFNYRTMLDDFTAKKHGLPSLPPPEEEAEGGSALAAVTQEPAVTAEPTETVLPSREGMDTLNISGSSQYNPDSFRLMIADIRTHTDGVICVFDLRQETHAFINGIAASLYREGNTGNVGLSAAEVLALEKEQVGALLGTELSLKSASFPTKDPAVTPNPPILFDVDEALTEQELCESEGVQYVRISCTDHLTPEDDDVDDFLAAYLALPEGAWLHFHCAAGVGRTGLFMMMADILRNPDVPLDDIISRQALLGASDPRDPMGMEADGADDKVALLQDFYDYVHAEQASGFPDTFSMWRQAK